MYEQLRIHLRGPICETDPPRSERETTHRLGGPILKKKSIPQAYLEGSDCVTERLGARVGRRGTTAAGAVVAATAEQAQIDEERNDDHVQPPDTCNC